MKPALKVLLPILLIISSGFIPVTAQQVTYTVQKIEDGDTLVLEIDGESVRVQLLGIDAPEDSPNPKFKSDLAKTGIAAEELILLGQGSTEYMKTLLSAGQQVGIQGGLRQPDRYGRTPAIVLNAAGRNISEAMVQDGYAVALMLKVGGPDDDFMRRLDRLERFSRKSSNGLWGRYPDLMRNWYDRSR